MNTENKMNNQIDNENQPKTRKIDSFQMAAIKAEQNSVVSAGAGSGKTTVLSERFTDLVINRNCKVEEILTLTFTKKATVEMSSRIYKVLKEKAPEQAKDFYKANIKTLDSYCSAVAKMGAHLYGISPDFTQDEETISKKAEEIALPFILEHRDNIAIKELVNTKDYAQIAHELFVNSIIENSTVAEPIDFDKSINFQQKEIISTWKNTTDEIIDLLNTLTNFLNDYDGKKAAFLQELDVLLQEDIPETPVLNIQIIENSETNKVIDFVIVLKKICSLRLPGGKCNFIHIKEAYKELRNKVDVLISLVNYVSGFYITKELIPLLKEYQDKINSVKRTSGILTFKDISNLATCILRDYPELRQIEKEKYKAIMIDEFQDNNQSQRDMLFMLAEKLERHEKGIPEVKDLCDSKLFFVGDEKQSIYRFRGADVSVFRSLSNDFKDGNLCMSTNYRSHPALITAFNTIFGGPRAVFYTEAQELENELPKFEAIYHNVTMPEKSQKEVSAHPEIITTPHIHIARYDSQQESTDFQLTNEDAEAQWISEKIKELTTTGIHGNIYKPSEIAILLRSYSLQPLYEKTFLNNGIPYNTETITRFFADGLVNDIFSFLSTSINDNDTFSYAQLLRSPFVNLPLEETNFIILANKKPFELTEQELTNYLSPQSLTRYLKMKTFFEDFQTASKSEPLTTLLTKLWYHSGYRFETLWNQKVYMHKKLFDLLFELAHNAEQQNMNLSAFVDNLQSYMDDSKRLENMDIPIEQSQGVHILTIHKSKGLEYKVVFICGTNKKGKNDTNSSPVFSSPEFGITINTPPTIFFPNNKQNYFYEKIKKINCQMKNAELRRLTYVALTRAIDELYITNGKYKRNDNAEIKFSPFSTDSIDTIYQILEPSINYFEGDTFEGVKFYDSEDILPYDFEENKSKDKITIKNTFSDKLNFKKYLENEQTYENASTIISEKVPKKYASPSQLHEKDDETTFFSFDSTSEIDYSVNPNTPYSEINQIVFSSIPKKNGTPIPDAKPRFDFTNFGTIAHAYMEAAINQEQAKYSNKDIVGLENSSEKLNTIISICEEMQQKYKNSNLGQSAINSKWHKAEYQFRCRVGSKIIKGIIDLVFQNDDGTYTIVDYKTNQKIEPEIYVNQLACYRYAIAQMLNVVPEKIQCFLYYLRFGKSIEITQECSKVDILQIIQNLDD